MTTPIGFEKVTSNDVVYFNPETHEIVVIGEVNEDGETHNCDLMGCSSVNHVVLRGKLERWSYSPPAKKVEPFVYQPAIVSNGATTQ